MVKRKNGAEYSRRSKFRFRQARANRGPHREVSSDEGGEERRELRRDCDGDQGPALPDHGNVRGGRSSSSDSETSQTTDSSSTIETGEEDLMSSDTQHNSSSDGDESSDDSTDDSSDDPFDNPSDDPSADSSDNESEPEIDDDELLYAGAPITVAESMLSIMSLVLAHDLSGACLTDILQLVAFHCPQPNLCRTTLYKYKKFFSELRSPMRKRYYCSICFSSLEVGQICVRCNRPRAIQYFIEIPVIAQVKSLFKRPGFFDQVRHHINRRKEVQDNYEDIYDGSVYQDLKNDINLLGEDNSFSLTWYTDGVKIFRSSKAELWPFYLTFNELPYRDRTKIDNTIIGGLWFGTHKPIPGLFLNFIRNDFIQLRNGINVNVPNLNEQLRIRVHVTFGTCDQPAKALFLNQKQFNGIYGCQVCKIRTIQENPPAPKRIYPFQRQLELRTHEETMGFARDAFQRRVPVFGVRGPSALAPFVYRPIETTGIDILHCVYMGITKNLGLIWFDPKFSNHAASLYGYVRTVDRRLSLIRTPAFLQRQPRSIAEHFKYWKGSELKSWLLYYSLPLLEDLMTNVFFDHHKLLVLGISLLNRDSISNDVIDLASRVLTEYVSRLEDLYGRTHLSSNLHLLLHLPEAVRKFGPLWTLSCFPYESLNGVLKKFVSGTRYADIQIYTAASMFMNLTAFKTERLAAGRPAHEFCQRLSNYKRKLPLSFISARMAIVGKMHRSYPLPRVIQNALLHAEIGERNIFLFKRLFDMKQRTEVSSSMYLRLTRTNSSCVKFEYDGRKMFGVVHSFVRSSDCDCRGLCPCGPSYYAIIHQCNVTPRFRSIPGGFNQLIFRSVFVDNYIAVEVHRLVCVCFLLEIEDRNLQFIVEPQNAAEIE